MKLAGSRILITGATGGLGAALATGLVAQGALLVLSARSSVGLHALADRLSEYGQRPEILVADWSTPEGRGKLIERVEHSDQPVSAVVLNAGVNSFGAFEEQSAERVAQLLQVDLVAPALLAHGMLPALKKRPAACLLFVGSTLSRLGHPGFAAYCAAKHGLHGLAKALRRECAMSTLRIAEVHPRAMSTAMSTADIDAVNRLQGAKTDNPERIAAQVIRSLASNRGHWQAGWPERLFVLLDQRLPRLLDRVLGSRWPALQQAARSAEPSAHVSPVPTT